MMAGLQRSPYLSDLDLQQGPDKVRRCVALALLHQVSNKLHRVHGNLALLVSL